MCVLFYDLFGGIRTSLQSQTVPTAVEKQFLRVELRKMLAVCGNNRAHPVDILAGSSSKNGQTVSVAEHRHSKNKIGDFFLIQRGTFTSAFPASLPVITSPLLVARSFGWLSRYPAPSLSLSSRLRQHYASTFRRTPLVQLFFALPGAQM